MISPATRENVRSFLKTIEKQFSLGRSSFGRKGIECFCDKTRKFRVETLQRGVLRLIKVWCVFHNPDAGFCLR